ncbi:MAG: diguanylate cyclase (GGDEF)-like protein/PAS domain S-box-containing protein [Motiliproteus sp.]|jgi:diguanylate cyclase (GGDEF)-like protein/PAS domain S-box-containing protein
MQHIGTVLIVDDNPYNLNVLSALLRQEGYRVRPALSGEIALRAIQASLPDLILLDVRMPGIDGYETCRRLQTDERSRNVPVIFISALQDTEDKLAGFRAGGVDYVAKPFQAEEVLARVKTHIQLYHMQQHLESMVEQRTRALALSEARYRVLFEDSPMPVMLFESDGLKILAVNSAFSRLLGYTAGESVGRTLDFAVRPAHEETLRSLADKLTEHSQESLYTRQLHFSHKDGQILDVEGVLQRVEYEGLGAQILMLQDITESRRSAERLQQATKDYKKKLEKTVYYDELTGYPNRALLIKRMRQGIQQVQRTGCSMAVFSVNIDDFKLLNDTYGEAFGDHLLINISERLRRCLLGGDTLARIDGNEFSLLLLWNRRDADLEQVFLRLQERISEPYISDVVTLTLSASIGVTLYPQDDADPETLLRHADQAMMLAKQNGKGNYQRFDPESSKQLRAHQDWVERIRTALANREFILYYQPKVDLLSRSVVGSEALIRWQHPERGLLPPGAFLPSIENNALMVDLGDWVIEESLGQMARWRAGGLDLAVSVNIAPQHLAHCNFTARLRELLAAHPDMPEDRLELEVLETSALDDTDKIEQLIVECRQLGIGFSLDDFGTGYSSLTHLRRLSADTLKIDQSFISDMLDHPGDQAIVAGVIGLAKAFNRKVIAEGVETAAHGEALLRLGCTLLQGYGIARPMPAQDLPGWVKTWPDAEWLKVIDHRAGRIQSGRVYTTG